MAYGIVYEALNLKTGFRYVGQTVSVLRKRWNGHCQSAKSGRGWELSKAIREHGSDTFQLKILCECETKQDLNVAERKFIAELNTVWPNGYNMTNGGEGPCEVTRQLISQRTKEAMSKLDPSWKERQKIAIQSEEVRNKISESTREAMQRPEMKEKMQSLMTDEMRERISKKLKGQPFSEERKRRIKEATIIAMQRLDVKENLRIRDNQK